MDARVNGRFLNGHSSGGWATLQLEVNYPKIFGGTWSTSPDPSDFHDFTGPDLYAPHANMYRKPDGSAWPLVRRDGKVVATVEQFAQLERVLGPYGGQLTSFDWVFSPKAPSGAPVPMFDRVTGEVDPAVVAYWHDHYDLAHIVEAHWTALQPDLTGRIHLTVGTADTFYLDGAAHKFEAVLQAAGRGAALHLSAGTVALRYLCRRAGSLCAVRPDQRGDVRHRAAGGALEGADGEQVGHRVIAV